MADVLVFDDDPMIGDLVSHLLRGKGLTVSHFLSGAGALQLVQENKPKLVVLDLMMPGVDGLTACRTLKSNPGTRGVRVAILTAKEFKEDREAALRYGADVFLTKPFDSLIFESSISRLLFGAAPPPVPAASAPPAPPLIATILPGAVVVQSLGLWVLFDAGVGLSGWLAPQLNLPPVAWLLLSRFQTRAVAEIAGARPILASGARLNLAGPDDAESSLNRYAAYVCASLPTGARAMPLLFPQREGEFSLAPGVRAVTRYTQHPGACLAYRLELQGRSIVYCPAHELSPDLVLRNKHELDKFRSFFSGADLLLHGYRRSLDEKPFQDGLGNGAWEPVVDLAAEAGVRHLTLLPQVGAPTEGLQERIALRLGAKGNANGMRFDVSRVNERVIL